MKHSCIVPFVYTIEECFWAQKFSYKVARDVRIVEIKSEWIDRLVELSQSVAGVPVILLEDEVVDWSTWPILLQ